MVCPHGLLLGDGGCERGTVGILPGECRLLSSGSGLFFGKGGALSLAIPDWENTGREKAGGNPYGICRRRIGKSSLSFLLFLL